VLAPLVGFDRSATASAMRRLLRSYIGALSPRPLAIGVGFELSQIETIYPQAFDIPMDVIVTEAETRRI